MKIFQDLDNISSRRYWAPSKGLLEISKDYLEEGLIIGQIGISSKKISSTLISWLLADIMILHMWCGRISYKYAV